jgi:hypothetical protein
MSNEKYRKCLAHCMFSDKESIALWVEEGSPVFPNDIYEIISYEKTIGLSGLPLYIQKHIFQEHNTTNLSEATAKFSKIIASKLKNNGIGEPK